MMDGRFVFVLIALNKALLLEPVFQSNHASLVQLLVPTAQVLVVQA